MNPLTMAMKMENQIAYEQAGPYKHVYDELKKLDEEFSSVSKNQNQFEPGPEPIIYAMANLLYSGHVTFVYPDPPIYGRKECRLIVEVLSKIPGGKPLVLELLSDLFPQVVFCTEHLYFLQRHMLRLFSLPDAQRPERLRGAKQEEWVFPMDRVERIRLLAVDTWKDITDKLEDDNHVNEAEQ